MADYDDGWWDFGTVWENEPRPDSEDFDSDPDDYTEDDRFFYEYSDRGADYEEDRMINRFDERNHYGDF